MMKKFDGILLALFVGAVVGIISAGLMGYDDHCLVENGDKILNTNKACIELFDDKANCFSKSVSKYCE